MGAGSLEAGDRLAYADNKDEFAGILRERRDSNPRPPAWQAGHGASGL